MAGEQRKKVFLIMDEQEERHDQPWSSYHIETSKRLDAIKERLETYGLFNDPRIQHLPRREASEDEIRAVHTKRYVEDVKSTETMTTEEQEKFCSKYEDIFVNSATWKRAKLAAGASIDLVSEVLSEKSTGIAFIRPPGHHAMPDEGCGFCIFNNVAIAAKSALDRQIARRIMIIDYDVHAGNGTQECVEQFGEDNCRLISIHRYENGQFWPNMPQTGIYHNYKNTMNVPLNTIGHSDSDYLAIFNLLIIPEIHRFRPDLLIVSSGFDASIGDPEGSMNVTPAAFSRMLRILMETGIPVAAILEGGYFLDALAADSEWALRSLLGETLPSICLEKIDYSISDTISKILEKYADSSVIYRKIQELRKVLGQKIGENSKVSTDYFGERTVHPPYETRGIYTPFSEEIIEQFRKKLAEILKSYASENGEKSEIRPEIVEISHMPRGFLGFSDGKIIVGNGNSVKIFANLIFCGKILKVFENVNFEEIILDPSLKKIVGNSAFSNLPILNL